MSNVSVVWDLSRCQGLWSTLSPEYISLDDAVVTFNKLVTEVARVLFRSFFFSRN